MPEERSGQMKTKQEIYGTVFMVLGTLLIALCVLLVLHNRKEDEEAREFAIEQLAVIQQTIAQHADEEDSEVGDSDTAGESETGSPDQSGTAPSDESETAPSDESDGEMPVVFIEGYGYIGYVSFPSLDLELPVMDRWDGTRLKLAPCRYYGSLQTDDLVVAGHNYRSGFGKLRNLNIGDEFSFTDMDGMVYFYRVEEIEVLSAADVTEMVESGWDLSLFTCASDSSRRLTIRCAKVSSMMV